MSRSLLMLGVFLFAAPCLTAADTPTDSVLKYTPPTAPVAPNPANLLLRLIGLTAALLVLCGVVIWLAKRGNRLTNTKGNSAGRLRHEGTLALDRRSAVHLIWVDGQTVAVTTDASGLRSIVVLSEPFDKALDEAEQREAA
ncbi:MAG TPA: flagellar biosynthetic protein FliO [Gemmata sp.]|nr:flagellar biosynthetic protein FliO [Gemmata sp.]